MTPENFVYWLQGMFELTNTKTMFAQQVEIIKNHLQLVFDKQTPDVIIDDVDLSGQGVEDLLDLIKKKKDG